MTIMASYAACPPTWVTESETGFLSLQQKRNILNVSNTRAGGLGRTMLHFIFTIPNCCLLSKFLHTFTTWTQTGGFHGTVLAYKIGGHVQNVFDTVLQIQTDVNFIAI